MELIRDDPIVSCMMETGYPPWVFSKYPDDFGFDGEEDSDVYIGNETAEF